MIEKVLIVLVLTRAAQSWPTLNGFRAPPTVLVLQLLRTARGMLGAACDRAARVLQDGEGLVGRYKGVDGRVSWEERRIFVFPAIFVSLCASLLRAHGMSDWGVTMDCIAAAVNLLGAGWVVLLWRRQARQRRSGLGDELL